MIEKGKSYISDNSCLKMSIINVISEDVEYIEFKGMLTHRTYGYYYETKQYKLLKKDILHWFEE